MQRVLDEGIKPYVRAIAEIWTHDHIACVMFEAREEKAVAEAFGHSGDSPVFELGHRVLKRYARQLEHRAKDLVAANWLRRRGGPHRILAFVQAGSLLINFEADKGYWFEPGSTDLEQGRNQSKPSNADASQMSSALADAVRDATLPPTTPLLNAGRPLGKTTRYWN